jgi:aconitase B
MDAAQLTEEGYYSVFGKSGARIEIWLFPVYG